MAVNNLAETAAGMQGRNCLVTGATSGIGQATALALAARGATVIVGGRDATKTAAVVAQIKAQSGNMAVDYVIADLSSQAQIHQMTNELKAKYSHLHVLINNAGVVYNKRTLSVDGVEMTFAVNVIAPFLLTQLLVDLLAKSGDAANPARVANIASGLESKGKIEFDNLQGERKYSGLAAYNNSKLALIMVGYEFARQLKEKFVTVNSLEPGVVATNLAANSSPLFKLGIRLASPFLLKPQQGAQIPLFVATAPQLATTTGKFFDKMKERTTAPVSYDLTVRQGLWKICQELTC